MRDSSVTIHVRMSAPVFRRFAFFDTFRVKRRWVSPCVFFVAFTALALVCFFSGKEQSGLLGGVMLAIGVGFPLVYVGTFWAQVRSQCKRFGLKNARPVYTLVLADKDIHVTNDMKKEAEVTLPWATLPAVYRGKGAFYLYAAPSRAFILPDGQGDLSPRELWDWIAQRVAPGHLHGKRP